MIILGKLVEIRIRRGVGLVSGVVRKPKKLKLFLMYSCSIVYPD